MCSPGFVMFHFVSFLVLHRKVEKRTESLIFDVLLLCCVCGGYFVMVRPRGYKTLVQSQTQNEA